MTARQTGTNNNLLKVTHITYNINICIICISTWVSVRWKQGKCLIELLHNRKRCYTWRWRIDIILYREVSVYRQQVKRQFWPNFFVRSNVISYPGSLNLRETFLRPAVARVLTSRPWPIGNHGLVPAEQYHILVTKISRSELEGTPLGCLHLHCHIDIILYGGDMRTCLFALATG